MADASRVNCRCVESCDEMKLLLQPEYLCSKHMFASQFAVFCEQEYNQYIPTGVDNKIDRSRMLSYAVSLNALRA
jgi:hypothetical protein